MCLRAMVTQLREQLDAEKRLNAAIKDKKVMTVTSHHHHHHHRHHHYYPPIFEYSNTSE